MIFNILENTTKLWMTKYIIGEIFSSGRATFYKNPTDQTVHHINILKSLSTPNNILCFWEMKPK